MARGKAPMEAREGVSIRGREDARVVRWGVEMEAGSGDEVRASGQQSLQGSS